MPGGARVEPRGWKVRSVSSLYKRCPGVLPEDSSLPGSGSVTVFLFLTSNKECSLKKKKGIGGCLEHHLKKQQGPAAVAVVTLS